MEVPRGMLRFAIPRMSRRAQGDGEDVNPMFPPPPGPDPLTQNLQYAPAEGTTPVIDTAPPGPIVGGRRRLTDGSLEDSREPQPTVVD
jgi:hypothetical protein